MVRLCIGCVTNMDREKLVKLFEEILDNEILPIKFGKISIDVDISNSELIFIEVTKRKPYSFSSNLKRV